MKRVITEFSERIRVLAEAAGGQRALARIIGVSPGAISGWLGTAQPYETTMRDIATKTGVPREWLKTGAGDEKEIIATFRRLLSTGVLNSGAFAETPPDMDAPLPAKGLESVIEKMAARQSSTEIIATMNDVARDMTMRAPERNALTTRLTLILAKKLAEERDGYSTKN
jgi:DNA-binding transcriptional regulator YdaS (Cro superfamily)